MYVGCIVDVVLLGGVGGEEDGTMHNFLCAQSQQEKVYSAIARKKPRHDGGGVFGQGSVDERLHLHMFEREGERSYVRKDGLPQYFVLSTVRTEVP